MHIHVGVITTPCGKAHILIRLPKKRVFQCMWLNELDQRGVSPASLFSERRISTPIRQEDGTPAIGDEEFLATLRV